MFITRIIKYINRLGLKVATDKTEAILFHLRGTRDLPTWILIDDNLRFSAAYQVFRYYDQCKMDFRRTLSVRREKLIE